MDDQQKPEGPEKEPPEKPAKGPFSNKLKDYDRLHKGANFIWDKRIEFLSGALVLIGLILSFFYIHIGGMLVGLGFGICFYEEIHNYFLQIKEFYTEQGLFKTLIWIATLLYFLISIPAFIIAAAVGFAVVFLVRWTLKK